MRLSLLAAWLASVAVSFAGQPPKTDPTPKTPTIVFPTFPAGEDKAPTPRPLDPAAVPKLAADTLYVVQSDVPFLQFASPPGLVKITKASGPVTMFAKFVDGDGKAELRTFSAKHVAIIQATGSGRVELLSVPVGAADEKDAVRKTVDVGSGQAPQPPPGPKPVDPVEPQPITSFRVIFVHESGDTNAAAAAVMNAKQVRDYLNANCTKNGEHPGWRQWDKDQDPKADFPVMKELWAAVKPNLTAIPCVVVEVNGKASIEPFPKSASDAVALFRKFNGGK